MAYSKFSEDKIDLFLILFLLYPEVANAKKFPCVLFCSIICSCIVYLVTLSVAETVLNQMMDDV